MPKDKSNFNPLPPPSPKKSDKDTFNLRIRTIAVWGYDIFKK